MIKPLKSTAAFVLGMHDALVSQIGVIVGLAFALADRELIILTSVITALSAGLSMAASSYLAEKTHDDEDALRAGLVTGGAYLGISGILIAPFVITNNLTIALGATFAIAVLTIFISNWAIHRNSKKKFLSHAIEMLILCTSVTIITFIIGELSHKFLI